MGGTGKSESRYSLTYWDRHRSNRVVAMEKVTMEKLAEEHIMHDNALKIILKIQKNKTSAAVCISR